MSQANQDSRLKFQENEYLFPYHYVTQLSQNGFREHFIDRWGINYATTNEFLITEVSKQVNIKSLTGYLGINFEVVEVIPFEKSGIRRKILGKLLSNRLFVLNNQTLLNRLYKWQKEQLFRCDSEKDCQRIFVKAIAK